MDINEIISQYIRSFSGKIPVLDYLAVQIINYLPYLLFFVVITTFIFGFFKKDKVMRFNAFNTAIFMTFSLIIAAIFSAFIYVPRPFIKYKFTPLVPHIGDSSFPSDHATESMSIALGFYSYNKILSAIIIFFSIVLCLAKVYAGHHSVLDILCSYIMVLILKFVYIKLFQNNVEKFYYKLENILFVHR